MLIVASVMMKLLAPVRTISRPLTRPSSGAERQRQGDRRPDRQARAPHQPAGGHGRADADRADREIEAAGDDHHHHGEKPMTMSIAVVRPSAKRLNGERKPGASRVKIAAEQHRDDGEAGGVAARPALPAGRRASARVESATPSSASRAGGAGHALAGSVLVLERGHDVLGHGLHRLLVAVDLVGADEGGAGVDEVGGLRRLDPGASALTVQPPRTRSSA